MPIRLSFLVVIWWIVDPVCISSQMLVKNINTCDGSVTMSDFSPSGDVSVFITETEEYGEEIYKLDPSDNSIELLADLTPGPSSSFILELDVFDGKAYVLNYLLNGRVNLWCIDVSNGQAVLLLDYAVSGTTSVEGNYFTKVGDKVYFLLRNSSYQFELWETDGTPENTLKVSFLPNNSFPGEFTEFNGMLYFVVNDGDAGHGLWYYNGFYAGQIFNPDEGDAISYVGELTVFDGSLFFVAIDTAYGLEIWRSDGSIGGNFVYTDFTTSEAIYNSQIGELSVLEDGLYFFGDDSRGRTLWKTSGPSDSLKIVDEDLNENNDYFFSNLIVLDGLLAFVRRSDVETSVYTSDGTSQGSVKLGILDTTRINHDLRIIYHQNYFYWNGKDATHGIELWKSNGQPGNAQLLRDIYEGHLDAHPDHFWASGNKVFFTAESCAYGREIWFIDVTQQSVDIVEDLMAIEASGSPHRFFSFEDFFIFIANDPSYGSEPHISDGTDDGTFILDITPGIEDQFIREFIEFNDQLYFKVSGGPQEGLHVTDGTAEGTQRIVEKNFLNFLNKSGDLLFADIFESGLGTELWKSDGTAEGTTLVKDIAPGGAGSTPWMYDVTYNGELYFSAHDGVHGQELWKSDGTEEGTVMVKEIDLFRNEPNINRFHLGQFFEFQGILYFSAFYLSVGQELWRTDGTEEGTWMVADLWPGSASGNPRYLGQSDTHFFISAQSSLGSEIFKSDGTEEGTALLTDLNPGFSSSFPRNFTKLEDLFVFTADHPDYGNELFITDGTASGTMLLYDIFPGIEGSHANNFIVFQDVILFAANDGVHGTELWKTDGTAEGTRLVWDVGGAEFSGDPGHLKEFDGKVYLSITDPTIGRELWKLDGLCIFPDDRSVDLASIDNEVLFAKNEITVTGLQNADSDVGLYAGESIIVESNTVVPVMGKLIIDINNCTEYDE